MKKQIFLLVAILSIGFMPELHATAKKTNPNDTTVVIKISAQCDMCKTRVEKAMAYEKGVKKGFSVDVKEQKLTITFDKRKNSVPKLCQVISSLGHDANEVKANKQAYSKLPDCCKKPEDRHQHGAGCKH